MGSMETNEAQEWQTFFASVFRSTGGRWFKAADLDVSDLDLPAWLQYKSDAPGLTKSLGWAIKNRANVVEGFEVESRADGKHGRLYRVVKEPNS